MLAPVAGAIVALWAAGGAAAYGPTPTPVGNTSGGFSAVLGSATRGSAGGSVVGRAGKTTVAVAVPAGALDHPVQLTLLAAERGWLARRLGTVAAAVAVTASTPAGERLAGRLSSMFLRLTLRNPAVGPGDRVVVWSPARKKFVPVPRQLVSFGRGTVTIRFDRASEFAVLGRS
jgi:hypothetical protein